jgi:hypothetical protein
MLSVIQQHLPVITRAVSLASISRIAAITVANRHYFHNHATQKKTIFDAGDDEVIHNKKEQLPNDKPWDGEEPVQHSVLRMIMDKYRAPLRVEGAARKSIPQPQLYHPQVMQPQEEEKSSGKKAIERQAVRSKMKQERLANARDAVIDYKITMNHPIEEEKQHISDNVTQATNKKDVYFDEWEEDQTPRNISDLGVLSDAIIRSARARGDFDDLPGRGKPLEHDPLIDNPFIDRTEYFLNRIVQRNGAAPPWVIMQMEVDTETTSFRSRLNSAFDRISRTTTEKTSIMQKFEDLELRFFEKQVLHVNSRVRSYNVMCPSPVRKQLLELDNEIEDMKKKYKLN